MCEWHDTIWCCGHRAWWLPPGKECHDPQCSKQKPAVFCHITGKKDLITPANDRLECLDRRCRHCVALKIPSTIQFVGTKLSPMMKGDGKVADVHVDVDWDGDGDRDRKEAGVTVVKIREERDG